MALFKARLLLLLLVLAISVKTSEEKPQYSDESLLKALREVAAETEGDSNKLNLPANASSIRENITDTFSCENRTYGYYADVDNDCQVFHVCLPSQTPSGRNVTYRWSFICPNETIFNQEYLTCTRPADSIDCKDSPAYYFVNMDIGKVSNKTEESKDKKDNRNIQKRKQNKRKENIIMENKVFENVIQGIINEDFNNKLKAVEDIVEGDNSSPALIGAVMERTEDEVDEKREEEMDRIVMERNMRNDRQMRRGSFRFQSDI